MVIFRRKTCHFSIYINFLDQFLVRSVLWPEMASKGTRILFSPVSGAYQFILQIVLDVIEAFEKQVQPNFKNMRKGAWIRLLMLLAAPT